jgi:hypothetical protein
MPVCGDARIRFPVQLLSRRTPLLVQAGGSNQLRTVLEALDRRGPIIEVRAAIVLTRLTSRSSSRLLVGAIPATTASMLEELS